MWDKSIFTGGLSGEKGLGLVLQNSVIFQCWWLMLSLRNMVRNPLRLLFSHPMIITYVRKWFPPCPTRLLWETVWRLSSPWGQRMSGVERGKMKRKGVALLACQGLSQLGKDSECDWLQFCCPTWQPAAVQNRYFAENASLFTWKVGFLSPQTLYIQAADCQVVISYCQTGISHLRWSVKVTGKRGYGLCWSSSKFFILP